VVDVNCRSGYHCDHTQDTWKCVNDCPSTSIVVPRKPAQADLRVAELMACMLFTVAGCFDCDRNIDCVPFKGPFGTCRDHKCVLVST
jgi:hypothetical protein